MGAGFTAINLSLLPPPDVLELVDYEATLSAMLAELRATLAKGIMVGGEKRTEITLREPTVGDNMAARQSAKGDNAGHEVNLLANLAGLSPDEIRSAKMRDYTRLQEALDFFNG